MASSREYTTISRTSDAGNGVRHATMAFHWNRRAGTVVSVIGLLAVLASVGLLARREKQQLRSLPEAASLQLDSLLPNGQSSCGKMEANIEYTGDLSGVWGTNFDHIPSAEMCCAMCHGVSKCKAFIWVKDAGLEGQPSQCWMKGAVPPSKAPKEGVVSGIPPARPPLPESPLAAPMSLESETDTIFCFSLSMPFGYEPGLLQFQQSMNASIFGCDAHAVYSNSSVPGIQTTIIKKDLSVKPGGDSYTLLNTWVFIAVFKKVIDDGWHKKHKWVVKVDPDAVFFPDRLRIIVKAHGSVGYINNCKFGLHGPIEVFSRIAMDALAADYAASFDKNAPKKCVEELHFGQWGEDFFLSQCLTKVLKVSRELDGRLMCEAHCDCPDWYWCHNGTQRVTFHPFKRVDLYKQCLANAINANAPETLATPAITN